MFVSVPVSVMVLITVLAAIPLNVYKLRKLGFAIFFCSPSKNHNPGISATVDDRQMGHVNQVGHLSKTHLHLSEIHEIGSVDTFESKQQNYDQI